MHPKSTHVPPLGVHWLTPLYDLVAEGGVPARRMRAAVTARVRASGCRSVLDVGCGTGTLAARLSLDVPAAAVAALDPDPAALGRARKKSRRLGAEVRFIRASATALPYPARTLDCVVSSMMMHHLTGPEKDEALSEIVRVLAPGGLFLLLDFTRPEGAWGRLVFPLMRPFDGWERTADAAAGTLPARVRSAGLAGVTPVERWKSAYGEIELLTAHAP